MLQVAPGVSGQWAKRGR